MISFTLTTVTLALSALSASAGILPRHRAIAAREAISNATSNATISATSNVTVNANSSNIPSTYNVASFEDYFVWDARFWELGCPRSKNSDSEFYAACCNPLLKNETLSSREPRCDPVNVASPISAPLTTAIATTSTSAPVETTTSAPAETTPASSPAPAPSSSSETPAPSPSDTPAPSPSPSSTPAPSPSPSSTPAPSPSPSSTPAPSPSPSPSSAPAPAGDTHTGRATFYTPQTGNQVACGGFHTDSDLIVAASETFFNTGLCGKQVQITNVATGQSVTATIQDACPPASDGQCTGDDFDLTPGTFGLIGSLSTGVLGIQWHYL